VIPNRFTTTDAHVETEAGHRVLLLISRDPGAVLGDLAAGSGVPWRIHVASNGIEAVNNIRSALAPEMMLVDLLPGDVDGLHTIGWLREVRPELPLIVLSSDNAPQTAELGRQWGARDQLAKPIQKLRLAAMLDRHIPKADHGHEFEYVEEFAG
jgi:CheY-like chemotaxis protein